MLFDKKNYSESVKKDLLFEFKRSFLKFECFDLLSLKYP